MNQIKKSGLTPEDWEELLGSDEKCLKFLSDLKWADGYVCRKCGNANFCPGKTPFSRRCTRCKQEESATTGTIFHNCKFPLSKAFYIAYHVFKGDEDISTYEFARRLSLRQMTCWNFKSKIQSALSDAKTLTDIEKESIFKILLGTDPASRDKSEGDVI